MTARAPYCPRTLAMVRREIASEMRWRRDHQELHANPETAQLLRDQRHALLALGRRINDAARKATRRRGK